MGIVRNRARGKKRPVVPVPTQFHERLENLRKMTLEASGFAVPYSYFHDELSAAPGFHEAGVGLKNPKLRKVVEKAIQRVVPTCRCGRLLLWNLGDFWHGLFDTSVGPVVLYYFEQEDVGLAGFMSGVSRTELIRFTVTVIENPGGVAVGGGPVGEA